ncbi:MAG TPA: phenylalanine--tRNA ligase subunit beta [Bacteroidota bacterium]|nr:phenylalanine--tRNA ligase subunit beta [Bacteroidota bacterium]
MKVSQKWLKEFVDFQMTPEQFTEELSMLGLEVESYEDLAKKYNNFVVGEVLQKEKHPKADRLSFCKVNVGEKVLDIVCGAPNVAAGQKVCVALIGALIPHDQHDPEGKPFVITNAKIRGVESFGMLCSVCELDLGDDASGILVLDASAVPGTPLADYFGMNDVVYEVGITPNRADCLSHIGVAREVGVVVNKKITLPNIELKESAVPATDIASVEILDAKRCPRYSARVLRNVKIAPSPKWLQDRLTSVGIRSINNIVDVTNYVLMETGHPLHAFDLDKLAGRKIIVKTASEGQKFVTLDSKERTLKSDTLMICDGEKPVAIGGVMGGENTEISSTTTNVLLEAAFFNSANIRRTSKYLGLSTEAAYRFERGADIDMTIIAVNRAAQLMQELAGAEILNGIIDVYPEKQEPAKIVVRIPRVNSIIGVSLTQNQIISLLEKIELISVVKSNDELLVTIPNFRTDITEEIDVIEEVARVFGYNNIETKTHASIDFTQTIRTDRFQNEIRDYLIGAGFHEILSIALRQETVARLGGVQPIKVLNPVSAEMEALRTSLIPGALQVVKHNLNHGVKDLRLFEIGNVFTLKNSADPLNHENYHEEERLLVVLSGLHQTASYGQPVRKVDVLDLKGEVSALLSKFNLDNYRFIYYDNPKTLTDPRIDIEINGTYGGFFGKTQKHIAHALDVEEEVFVCELSVSAMRNAWVRERKFSPLPKFPSVTRDLAFTVDVATPQQSIEDVIRKVGRPLLQNVMLFDMYIGQQTGASKKSVAYTMEFQAADHTLIDDEVDAAVKKIVEAVQQQCDAVVRS